MTFRLPQELADELRELPNQTRFVETALREALGFACPLCEGSGRWQARRLTISNFRRRGLPVLERAGALELRRLVRIGRQLSATALELEPSAPGGVAFVMTRGREVLLTGQLPLDARGGAA
ncbi:MAG TPA: hypothetical protein VI197_02125 [Polyangiaceae bacterium]